MHEDVLKWVPQRTGSAQEQNVLDPFRCIVFDDIKPLICSISTSEGQAALLNSFIQFLTGGLLNLSKGSTLGWAIPRCRDPSLPHSSLGTSFPFTNVSMMDPDCLFSDTFPSNDDINFISALGNDWLGFLKRVLELQAVIFPDTSHSLVVLLALEAATSLKRFSLFLMPALERWQRAC